MDNQKKAEMIIRIDQLHRMNFTFSKKIEQLDGATIESALRKGYFAYESLEEEYLTLKLKELMEKHNELRQEVLNKIKS